MVFDLQSNFRIWAGRLGFDLPAESNLIPIALSREPLGSAIGAALSGSELHQTAMAGIQTITAFVAEAYNAGCRNVLVRPEAVFTKAR